MRVAFLTETAYRGKWPVTMPNARTEIAWQLALDADHFNIYDYEAVKGYDAVFIIFPKGTVNLNVVGSQLVNTPNSDSKIFASPIVSVLKESNKKVCFVQEGPCWLFNDYTLVDQFNYYNQLQQCDILFAHNASDMPWYRGLFPDKQVTTMPTLMIEDMIRDIRWQPSNKVMVGGNMCFPSDVRVLMSDGKCKEIGNVIQGESVMVHGRNYEVLHKFCRYVEEDLVEITTYGNRTIRCTKNHKICGIHRSDYLLWNGKRQHPVDREEIKTAKVEDIEAADLSNGDFVLVPKSSLFTQSKYSDDLMWLFGFWIAEGSVERRRDRKRGNGIGRIEFSIHRDENYYADKVKSILQENFGVSRFGDRLNKGTKSRVIRASNQKLAKFLIDTFGSGALKKKIPVDMFLYSNILVLIQGIFCGDGTFSRRPDKSARYSMLTSSSELGDNISTVFDLHQIRHSKTFASGKELSDTVFTHISVHNKIDIDRIGGNKIHNFTAKDKCTQYVHELGVLVPIKSVKTVPFKGNVYNIDVDRVHKYVANGMLVNNCRWYGGFQSYMVASDMNAEMWVPSSHASRDGENQMPGLHVLPRVSWLDWIRALSNFKYAINLMPTVAAGTFSLNCAYFGIPCIANEKLDTQRICFPQLAVDAHDVEKARNLAYKLVNDSAFYEACSKYAKHAYHEHYNKDKFLQHIHSALQLQ
jgi:hypothetical protein